MTTTALPRFIKVYAGGGRLAADAAHWDAVEDISTGLIWSVAETRHMTWHEALEYCKSLELGGVTAWRLPTRQELLSLVDLSRHTPAIDTAFFPDCKSDWYWTSTPAACSPGGCAWFVLFSDGCSIWDSHDGRSHVRAVLASRS